jgi:hypothetical protein
MMKGKTYLLYLAFPVGSGYLVNYTLHIGNKSVSPFEAGTTTNQRYDQFVPKLKPSQGTQWNLYVDSNGNFYTEQIYPPS